MTERRIKDMARWGFEVTRIFPSGQVRVRHPNGKIMKAKSFNQAYEAVAAWWRGWKKLVASEGVAGKGKV